MPAPSLSRKSYI